MAGAPMITNLPIERPDETGSHFMEPWLEPFLLKHSSWYRRHMTKTGRRESKSKSTRNSSVTTTSTEGGNRKASVEEEYGETSAEHEKERKMVEV